MSLYNPNGIGGSNSAVAGGVYRGDSGGYEESHLTFTKGTFWLGSFHPSIILSDSKITIGCKTASVEAFDELCRQWIEFRKPDARRRILQ